MTSFWSIWIIVLTLGSIFGVTWLLFANRKTENVANEVKSHVYDGIEEYDNPLPVWWFYMFLVCVGAALVYLILYPGLGSYKGALNWTSSQQYFDRASNAEQAFLKQVEDYMMIPAADLAKDFRAVKMGERIYKSNCAVCHGQDARGGYAFPNLTDQDWLYGGTEEAIKQTLLHGRIAAMPSWKQQLGEDIDQMAAMIGSLHTEGLSSYEDTTPFKQYQMLCTSCHGQDAKGNQLLGAPNLTDDIWLYGGSLADIKLTLEQGRNGQMPAQKDLLSPERIHLLTAFILSFQNDIE